MTERTETNYDKKKRQGDKMKIVLIAFLIVFSSTVSAAETQQRPYIGQIEVSLRLFRLDLKSGFSEKLFENRLNCISGESSSVRRESDNRNFSAEMKGEIISVDQSRKIISTLISLEFTETEKIKTVQSLYFFRGETKRIPVYTVGNLCYELEAEATFGCYECPSPWDTQLPSGSEKPVSLLFRISSRKNETLKEIGSSRVQTLGREKGNFQIKDQNTDYSFEIEPKSVGEATSLKFRLWRVEEKGKLRSTFYDEYRLVLLPDETRQLTAELDSSETLFIDVARVLEQGLFSAFRGKSTDVSPAEAVDLIQKGKIKILDVRTSEEFSAGHLPSAINLDYYSNEFESRLAVMEKKEKHLIYCKKGARSREAARMMQGLGFSEIFVMNEGYDGYLQSGFKTEK